MNQSSDMDTNNSTYGKSYQMASDAVPLEEIVQSILSPVSDPSEIQEIVEGAWHGVIHDFCTRLEMQLRRMSIREAAAYSQKLDTVIQEQSRQDFIQSTECWMREHVKGYVRHELQRPAGVTEYWVTVWVKDEEGQMHTFAPFILDRDFGMSVYKCASADGYWID